MRRYQVTDHISASAWRPLLTLASGIHASEKIRIELNVDADETLFRLVRHGRNLTPTRIFATCHVRGLTVVTTGHMVLLAVGNRMEVV